MNLADKIVMRQVGALVPYASNSRTHTPEQISLIARSIETFGFTNPILVDGANGVVAGHARLKAAQKLGLAEVPTIDLSWLTLAERQAYVIADNQTAISGAGWDPEMLRLELGDLKELGFDLALTGFSDIELGSLFADKTEGLTDPDDAPEAPEHPVSQTGDLWLLGRHRLLCGDSTVATDVERVLGGARPDCVITDPPYCSGGFQEIGKAAGSIGSSGTKHKRGGEFSNGIANDRLSTRGYIALIKNVLTLCRAPIIYVFTDWRMWINLFDVAESSGYAVRSMIVWDKGVPAMGIGWRSQHEIILLGAKETINFDNHKARGNVVSAKRTGNPLHPTQKPIEIIDTILDVTDFARSIYDPFGGSGTTLIACEQSNLIASVMDLSAGFVDVAVKRWQDFTGEAAVLDGDGRTFDQIAAERHPQAASSEASAASSEASAAS